MGKGSRQNGSGRKSRVKGASAEREVAVLLEAWWGQLEPGCKFKRTPVSGGWSSPDVRMAFQTAGDLVTTAKRFPWSVEVKRREGFDIENVRHGRRSPVWGWWEQTRKAAKEMGKEPMLWFRKNNSRWFLMLGPEWGNWEIGCAQEMVSESRGVWLGFAETILLCSPLVFAYRGPRR